MLPKNGIRTRRRTGWAARAPPVTTPCSATNLSLVPSPGDVGKIGYFKASFCGAFDCLWGVTVSDAFGCLADTCGDSGAGADSGQDGGGTLERRHDTLRLCCRYGAAG